MLRNREKQEEFKLRGVNLSAHPIKLRPGMFTSLRNYIPAKVYKIKRHRGVDLFTSDAVEITPPGPCGSCPTYIGAQSLTQLATVPTALGIGGSTLKTPPSNWYKEGNNLVGYAMVNEGTPGAVRYDHSTVHVFRYTVDVDTGTITGTELSTKPDITNLAAMSMSNDIDGNSGAGWNDEPSIVLDAFVIGNLFTGAIGGFIYPEREEGVGQGIIFPKPSALSLEGSNPSIFGAQNINQHTAFGGAGGYGYSWGTDNSKDIIIKSTNTPFSGVFSAPVNWSHRLTTVEGYTAGKLRSLQPSEAGLWTTMAVTSGSQRDLLLLDPDDYTILNTYAAQVSTFGDTAFKGQCVVDDRWFFVMIQISAFVYRLYVKDLTSGGFEVIDDSITVANSPIDESTMYMFKDSQNTVYLTCKDIGTLQANDGRNIVFEVPCPG